MMTSGKQAALRDSAFRIVEAAISRVDPEKMTAEALKVESGVLRCVVDGAQAATLPLAEFQRIVVIGFGKAAASMALGVEKALGDRIEAGVVVVKYDHGRPLERIRIREAGHPVPDQNGLDAAAEIAAIAAAADERTLVINLISGGGSALLTLPYRDKAHELTLLDMQETTQALLRVGADITEINTVRRHLSAVKGGRLAAQLHPATSISLVLSDVVGDELSSIASGPTVGDASTFGQAVEVLKRYHIWTELGDRVQRFFEAGLAETVPDTPAPGHRVFKTASTFIIGSNIQALRAASEAAAREGFEPLLLTSRVEGEAREIARFYTAIASDVTRMYRNAPVCIIAGGETTVTVKGEGLGGRNQEMATAALLEMARHPSWYERVLFVASSTDGTDGPTDAAGGMADLHAVRRLAPTTREAQVVLRDALLRSDSYWLLSRADALLKTGPTGTNVCDIQLVLHDGGEEDDTQEAT